MDVTSVSTTGIESNKPSEKYKAKLKEDAKAEASALEGIDFINADQDKDMKANMRPDPDNSRLVRQGRMNPKNGADCSTPKTRKVNSFFPNKRYWDNFDGIKFYDSKDKSWKAKK